MVSLVKQIVALKSKIGRKIKNTLRSFKKNIRLNSEQKFLELCFCILVANTSLMKTKKIWDEINKGFIYFSKNSLKRKLKKLGYRFYNKRTNYIVFARKFIKEIDAELKNKNESSIREWLVKNIKGIGWKEASHFLRNMGFQNFAILDRHVLRVLNSYKILDGILPLTRKNYLEIERKLKRIADRLNISLAELDLHLFYIDTQKIPKK